MHASDSDRARPRQREAIAYHGWGLDRHCWEPWRAVLAELGISLAVFDRGYFGAPSQPTFHPGSQQKIILAHSYGLHRCPPQQLCCADWVIVWGGFRHFHPPEPRAERRSRLRLRQMICQFDEAPTAVLRAFWQGCGLPKCSQPSPTLTTTGLNLALLAQDLEDLDASALCLEDIPHRTQWLILHGQGDGIVPVSQGQALALALGSKAKPLANPVAKPLASASLSPVHFFALEGPHALPFSHLPDCWQVVRPPLQGSQGTPQEG